MKLVVGLGNPGKEYEKTRHNSGFLALENLGNWKFEKKFNAEMATKKIGKEKVVLVKPMTFMNKSGDAVGKIARFYKIKPKDVIVVYDEIDLPLGTLRIKQSGSSGGHKGLESVIRALKSPDFVRVRIGTAPRIRRMPAEKFVLGKFTAAETKKLKPVLKRVNEAITSIITDGLPKTMSLHNRS